jgi:hypothetical protein
MYQIVEQTREEKIAMYMKMPKKHLVDMLINCNDIILTLTQAKNYVSSLSCDKCGCHPNTIYTTNKGRFCENCKNI